MSVAEILTTAQAGGVQLSLDVTNLFTGVDHVSPSELLGTSKCDKL